MISTGKRVEIRPFKAEDMLYIIGNGIKEGTAKMVFGDRSIEETAEATEQDGLSMTGLVDGVIVGCGGIKKLWYRTGEVWLMLSPAVHKYPMRTGEVIIKGLKELIDTNYFTRLQGWCRVDFPQAHTVFRHLGFTVEGRARKYTPDQVDCLLYGKVEE
jgi:hypothetical protein